MTAISEKLDRKFKDTFKQLVFSIPFMRPYNLRYPPGHYYSPIPSQGDIRQRKNKIFDGILAKPVKDVDLNETRQKQELEDLFTFYQSYKSLLKESGIRYSPENRIFEYTDAFFLHAIIRKYQSEQYYEIGSGYSSAIALDTGQRFLDNISYFFVEPYPDRLHSLINEHDRNSNSIRITEDLIQNVEPEEFTQLKANDILFIDSSHITKLGSDVNYIYFEILPRIASGVLIHVHDIEYPFEYEEKFFLKDNNTFNEAYLLRAFLMNNNQYEIILWPSYLIHHHRAFFEKHQPECLQCGNGSIWLRKK